MGAIDLGAFASAKTNVSGTSRDFPLQVESFDLEAVPNTVTGRDMSSGDMARVTVFLRDLKAKTAGEGEKSSNYQRASLFDFGNDPFANFTDADMRNPQKLQEVMNTMNGKCSMRPGGILMIQGAYEDAASGHLSAAWANRLAANGEEVNMGHVAVLSPVLARLTVPSADGQNHFAEVVYPETGIAAGNADALDAALADLLTKAPNGCAGRSFAVVHLTSTADGSMAINIVDRRRDKNASYAEEPVSASIARFWGSMSPAYVSSLKGAINTGEVLARVVQGVRYRFVGTSLDELKKQVERRAGQRWEHFKVGEQQTGWMMCSVTLRLHKRTDGSAGVDYFPTGVWPVDSGEAPKALETVV